MIEFDKNLCKVTEVINKCYQTLFPYLPCYPKFTFTRAMIAIWKSIVYNKLESKLFQAFVMLYTEVRTKKSEANSHSKMGFNPFNETDKNIQKELLLSRYLCKFNNRLSQSIVDISVNDLRIHFLGSTKFVPDGPYSKFNELILQLTKYTFIKCIRDYYNQLESEAISLSVFQSSITNYKSIMGRIILPMTLRGIENISQQSLESYCRGIIRKEYSLFSANQITQPSNNLNPPLLTTNIYKYIKPLSPEFGESFLFYLNKSEPELIEFYEHTVIF